MNALQREEEPRGEYPNLWAVAQTSLAKRIPAAEFAAWIEETRIVAYRDGQAVIAVPNVFARDAIDITFRSDIVDVLQTITGTGIVVDVVIDDSVR
jgi:chromosomal replication initiation ATPase DnaA